MDKHNFLSEKENDEEIARESAAFRKRRGLTFEFPDRQSPSMVTLESLVSEWPPNTFDSGYVPSPHSIGGGFSYLREDGGSTSDDEYIECSESGQHFHRERNDHFSPIVTSVASRVDTNAVRSGTPPVKIPVIGKPSIVPHELDAFPNTGGIERDNDDSDPYGVLDFEQLEVEKLHENDVTREDDPDCNKKSRFVRPRTYSCPETSRSTPNRPPVPLFPPVVSPVTPEVFNRQYPVHFAGRGYLPKALTDPCTGKVQNFLTENSRNTFETTFRPALGNASKGQETLLKTAMDYPQFDSQEQYLPKVHTRYWSTPVTMDSDGRPMLIPPAPVNVKPSTSRDAVVDLSNEGPGHRRRVLVLSLPDVVVETGAACVGTDVTEDSRSLAHSRQGSSCSRDGLGPLPGPVGTSPVPLRPKTGRRYGRPRALSCEVTLEETIGRALRHIADDFQSTYYRDRQESGSLLGRVRRSVRRSFSRILNTVSPVDAGQPHRSEFQGELSEEELFYFPQDRMDFGEPIPQNCVDSRQRSDRSGVCSQDCKKCLEGYEFKTHAAASCKLRLVETQVDGKSSLAFEQQEEEDYAFEYYL